MSIHYALEIFTDSALTNATYGLKSGVFRFVTDRPDYTGTDGKASGEIDFNSNLYGSGILGCKAITPGTVLDNYAIHITFSTPAYPFGNPYHTTETGIYWNQNPGGPSWRDSYLGWVEIYIPGITGTIHDIVTNAFSHIVGTPFLTFAEVSPGAPFVATDYFQYLSMILSLIPGTAATYGASEIDKDGTPIGGQNITNPFYEDFLQKSSFDSDPERNIDLTGGGSYSQNSSFAFTLRGDLKFWNYLLDPLNSGSYDSVNAINLTGRTVICWVIIDDVFYQVGRGIITNNPYTETDFKVCVGDDSANKHKVLPPVVQTQTISSELQDSTAGTPIPIVLGDVPYSKILKKAVQNQYLQVSTNGNFCAAINYVILSNSYSANQRCKIDLLNGTQQFAADQLAGYYLSVASGLNASTQIFKIVSNDVSVLYTPTGYFSSYKTTIYLDSLLIDSNGLLIAAAATSGSSTNNWFDSTDLAWTLHYIIPVSASAYAVQNTWWFQVSTFAVNTFISNLTTTPGLGLSYKVWTYDSNLKLYLDISSVVNLTQSELSLIANSAQADGKVTIYEPIDFLITEFGLTDKLAINEIVTDTLAIDEIKNKSRITTFNDSPNAGYKFTTSVITAPAYYLRAKFKLSVMANSYDDIFFLADADWRWNNAGEYATISIQGILYYIYDQYGNIWHDTWTAQKDTEATDIPPYGGAHVYYKYKLNLIPNSYYPVNQIAGDDVSLFSYDANSQRSWTFPHYPYSFYHSFKNFVKGAADYDGTKDLSRIGANVIDCQIVFNQGAHSSQPFTIWLKQMTLLGSRIVETITGDVFTSAQGETVNNDGVTPTNNVYAAFRHILEYYDGIPAAMIDYGVLSTTRNTWHVGRTLTERKNSIEYLNELCAHSFVAMFATRTGRRGLAAFGDLTDLGDPGTVFDSSIICKDSIDSYDKTDISQLYNNFLIKYNYDPGLQDYLRSFFVANVDKYSTFPALTDFDSIAISSSSTPIVIGSGSKSLVISSGLSLKYLDNLLISNSTTKFMSGYVVSYNKTTGDLTVMVSQISGSGSYSSWDIYQTNQPTWYNCFGGIDPLAASAYSEAQAIWDMCKSAYLINKTVKQAQQNISELPWFIDRKLFDPDTTWGTGDTSSAYYFLKLNSGWTTIQKNITTFSIPITSATIIHDLLEYVGFNDVIFTNSVNQRGWISGWRLNTAEDKIQLTLTLIPSERSSVPVPPAPSTLSSRLISVQGAPLTSASII